MSQSRKMLRVIPDTTLRRLRSTPSYFFLIWRWSMWLYALIVILGSGPSFSPIYHTCVLLLFVTLLQTLVVTFYAPVFQPLFVRLRLLPVLRIRPRKQNSAQPGLEDEATLFTPLIRTHNRYRDIAIYALDVIICGLVTYYSGPFSAPTFGDGSPFYRYGMSTAFAAALAYRYPGGIAAAIGYDLFIVLGIFFPPHGPAYTPNVIDIVGSLIDTPVAALLAAFIASLLANYAQSKKREQENVRWQRALLNVGETIVRASSDKERLLQKSAEQLCQGGHFDRVIIALIGGAGDDEHEEHAKHEIASCIEVDRADSALPDRSKPALEQVTHSGQRLIAFEPLSGAGQNGYGIARLYLPFLDGHVPMILGAESQRLQPFDSKQEMFLTITGAQLSIALDNVRLTEQTIQLAASAERSRIAREIHDGIAQLVYMLSLQAETCVAQSRRIAGAAEDAELITPLEERLAKLVTLSKQALWETRNYMFSLKPLMSGVTTLEQMLTSQVREFEAISSLPVRLEIHGVAEPQGEDQRMASRQAPIGAAIFRIVQEALTNAYKHATATEVQIHLRYQPGGIEVTICDNGRGLLPEQAGQQEDRRIYSGHGLRGMRERAEELGGSFELGQSPAGGVKIRVWIPTTTTFTGIVPEGT